MNARPGLAAKPRSLPGRVTLPAFAWSARSSQKKHEDCTRETEVPRPCKEPNADPAQAKFINHGRSHGSSKGREGGGEAPPSDPAEAEAAINAEADKAGAAGNSDLMAKLKAAATNKKIQGAFMDVKNNGVSAAMKYKDDAE